MWLWIILLFFFAINWLASYTMAIIPIHLLNGLGSFLSLMLGIMLLMLLSWFFGE